MNNEEQMCDLVVSAVSGDGPDLLARTSHFGGQARPQNVRGRYLNRQHPCVTYCGLDKK